MANVLDKELDQKQGVLRLKPTFVARNYPGLGRLGIKKFSAGKRGWLCERWMASSVVVRGQSQIENEGLSELDIEGVKLSLKDALALSPERMVGKNYAKLHNNRFGVLTKILDIGKPISWHVHPRKEQAKKYWNMNPKEEAYYFLDQPNKGPLPYSHLGMHPDTTKGDLLPILKRWNDDKVLDLSPAYRLNVGEGFLILAGVIHAPGTALTLEAQEESDVGSSFQPMVYGKITSKEQTLLNGPKTEEEAMELIDWKVCTDPKFYSRYHIVPEMISEDGAVKEYWVYNPKICKKFTGKEVRVSAKKKAKMSERGPFLLLAWKGQGTVNGVKVAGGNPKTDELFVSYEAAAEHEIVNEGKEELVFFKIFGPDINTYVKTA